MKQKVLKSIAVMLSALMCAAVFWACSDTTKEGRLSVVVTNFPCYDLARAVYDDDGITMLIKPGTETHNYDPSVLDIAKIDKCDIFIYIGGENDAWVDGILASLNKKDRLVVKLIDFVEPVYEDGHSHEDGHNHEDEHGHNHGEGEADEHIWTSPVNMSLMLAEVEKAFIDTDPEYTAQYEANAAAYRAELAALHSDYTAFFDGFDTTLVVADRFPFAYLVHEYDVEFAAAASGCDTSGDIPIERLTALINTVTDNGITCIYYIELSNMQWAETVKEESIKKGTACETALLHSCHNVTANEFIGGETYLTLMRANLVSLAKAVKN